MVKGEKGDGGVSAAVVAARESSKAPPSPKLSQLGVSVLFAIARCSRDGMDDREDRDPADDPLRRRKPPNPGMHDLDCGIDGIVLSLS